MYNQFDIGGLMGHTLKFGRLKVIDWIPVAAGDKVEARYQMFIRTSPTRYPMKVPFKFETGAFYMPLRQLVGSAQTGTYRTPAVWAQELLKLSQGDSSGLTNIRSAAIGAADATGIQFPHEGVGLPGIAPLREHVMNFYYDVWNEYFRNKQYHKSINTGRWRQRYEAQGTHNEGGISGNLTTTTETQRMYGDRDYSMFGKIICNLKDLYTDPITAYAPTKGNVAIQSDQLNLIKLGQQRLDFRREVDQQVAHREYQQFLQHVWGGMVSDEAEYKPKIIGRSEHWQDFFDIDATDGGQLGRMIGKTAMNSSVGFPSTFCPEHGYIMVCAWARFPLIIAKAHNRLVNINLQDAANLREFLADPAHYEAQAPQAWNVSDFVADGADATTGFSYPYGHSYRREAAKVSSLFDDRDVGYPMVREGNSDARHLIECPADIWQNVFLSDRLGHIQLEIDAQKTRYSMIPDGGHSIYTGTHAN